MSQAAAQPRPLPGGELISLDSVRTHLAATWLGGSALIVILVVIQSLLGRYGSKTQDAWGWLLPTIMPTLGMIVSVLGYSALDPLRSTFKVRKSFFQLALWLSVFYELLILLTILIQPFSGSDAIELMHTSNLWLGPCQGLVASALGVLFVSKKQKGEQKES